MLCVTNSEVGKQTEMSKFSSATFEKEIDLNYQNWEGDFSLSKTPETVHFRRLNGLAFTRDHTGVPFSQIGKT